MITSASAYWLWRTGLASLNSIGTFSERYDGSGSRRQFVKNPPIQTVTLVQIGLTQISPSPDYVSPGYVVDQEGKSISIIGCASGVVVPGASLFYTGQVDRFCMGMQNVLLQYTGGFNGTPPDVEDKVIVQVATNFKRRGWIDQASQSMAQGAGTISYRSWAIPPDVQLVIDKYSRKAIV